MHIKALCIFFRQFFLLFSKNNVGYVRKLVKNNIRFKSSKHIFRSIELHVSRWHTIDTKYPVYLFYCLWHPDYDDIWLKHLVYFN